MGQFWSWNRAVLLSFGCSSCFSTCSRTLCFVNFTWNWIVVQQIYLVAYDGFNSFQWHRNSSIFYRRIGHLQSLTSMKTTTKARKSYLIVFPTEASHTLTLIWTTLISSNCTTGITVRDHLSDRSMHFRHPLVFSFLLPSLPVSHAFHKLWLPFWCGCHWIEAAN